MVKLPASIDILPEHLIDQIKAGEVIERPGNLIKEIIENSIDADATKIELTIKNNGLDFISIKDNGHGINFKDLPLAFSRHATSKISRFEDLYQLHSYGFRGEALASIASIAKLHCITQTSSGNKASEIKIDGGHIVYHGERVDRLPGAGTEIVIRDLFYNTPARLKFIQSQQSEKQFIKKIFYAFVMARPEIEFHLKIDETDKEIFPREESLKNRLEKISPKVKNNILYVEHFYENTELRIYLVPDHIKFPIKLQYVFINNRFILDKQIHRIITNSLDAAFGFQSGFQYLASFDVAPDSIDVNVHPSKTIVKCLDFSKMISLLTSSIKELGNRSIQNSPPDVNSTNFNPNELFPSDLPHLKHEPQKYNFEGFFSPHNIPQRSDEDYLWLDGIFLKKIGDTLMAISARKLLELFVEKKMGSSSSTVPLLVSEPFPLHECKKAMVEKFKAAGAEIDQLGEDTLVMRGIPEWMNGLPLKKVISLLLFGKNISEIIIEQNEWSQSTWNEILNAFSPDELVQKKIMLNLQELILEKLK